MIKKLKVEHYKSIGSIEVELEPVTIFVGVNGSGKSNIVDALKFVRDAVKFGLDRAVSDRHGIDSIRQWSPSKPYFVSVTVEFETPSTIDDEKIERGYFLITLGSTSGQYRIIREEGSWQYFRDEIEYDNQDEPISTRSVKRSVQYTRDRNGKIELNGYDPAEHIKGIALDAPAKDELYLLTFTHSVDTFDYWDGFTKLRRSVENIESYSIFPNTLRNPQSPSNDARLASDGSNLTSIFKVMSRSRRGAEAKNEIVSSLKSVMPGLETIVIQGIGGLMVPQFYVRESDEKATQHAFNVSQVSDGTLRVLGLLTAIHQTSSPAVIALEEPEQTVHPAVVSVLSDAIRSVSGRTQVLLTTHSPDLLDQFPPESIRAVEVRGGLTVVGPIKKSQTDAVKARLMRLGELMTIEGLIVG